MNDIFGICNHNPPDVPPRTTPVPPEFDDEFTKIFVNDYCQGLDLMLQTTWFSTNNNALNRVFADRALHEEAAYFTEIIKYRPGQADMTGVFSQEARLIWHLLGTCKHTAPATSGTDGTPSAENEDLSLREVRGRFDILEALLTNQNLPANPLRQITYPAGLGEAKEQEIQFWQLLGDFVQYADAESAPPGAADQALAMLRLQLHMIEVRDAIYSMAIARYYGNRTGGFPNALPPALNPEADTDLNKISVAMSFISYESRQSSQQVLARICDMAMLSWTVARSP